MWYPETMTGPDYSKRDYLLPKGCKDLADTLVINVSNEPTVLELAALLGKKPAALIADLFQFFVERPDRLPEGYREVSNGQPPHRAVCDYIAGMTDGFLRRTLRSATVKLRDRQQSCPEIWIRCAAGIAFRRAEWRRAEPAPDAGADCPRPWLTYIAVKRLGNIGDSTYAKQESALGSSGAGVHRAAFGGRRSPAAG